MTQLQSPASKDQNNDTGAPQKDSTSALKKTAMWGLLILASAGIGTGIRTLREQIGVTNPTATSTLDLLSPSQTQSLLNTISTISEKQGVPLERIRAAHPSGYLLGHFE